MKVQLSKPRIWVTGVFVLVAGGMIAAALLIGNVAFLPDQVDAVTTACPQCHGTVPAYELAYRVHAKHAAFDCVRCHGDNSGVVLSNSVPRILNWSEIICSGGTNTGMNLSLKAVCIMVKMELGSTGGKYS